jgi:alpha-glucosidase
MTGTPSSAALPTPPARPTGAVSGAWWRHAVIYQVYPRSFADADGDGLGDLPGITARLDHLVELGVDALWLSPFYRSPQADAGYDVSDYRDVDPIFGTLADALALIDQAHARGLRVIIDLVPNHTSSEHPWFREALAGGPGHPARDRYLFRDGRGPAGATEPNDWPSTFGGPAWTRVPDGQWYLHLFDVSQPDLNWDNPQVRAEFDDILRTWLDRGVDGFRVDVAHGLVKAAGLPDLAPPADPGLDAAADSGPKAPERRGAPMWDQDGVHDIYRGWRAILDGYPGERILVAEAWVSPADRLVRYIRPDEMHQAFNFEYLTTAWEAKALREVVTASLAAAGSVGAPTTWVLSNHDVIRHATRLALQPGVAVHHGLSADDVQPDLELGLRRARAATLLMLALPGCAYCYQGEELGLPEDIWLPDEVRQDPAWVRSGHTVRGRDGCRVPLPWQADAPSYGFGPGPAAWLPQPPIWARYALDRQRGVPGSTYELYRSALALRREHELGSGAVSWLDVGPDAIGFTSKDLVVITNFGAEPVHLAGPVLVASGPLTAEGAVPADTTVWCARSAVDAAPDADA